MLEPATGGKSDVLAVMLTGDGGWRRIDVQVTDRLRSEGIPVAGLLTNVYFAERRSPEEAAAELARIIREAATRWSKSRVILIGYSRGADVLPFLINRLPLELRAKIAAIALLGLEPNIDFKYHVSWIPFYHPREPQFPVMPELEKLRGLPILCVYGTMEHDSLCTTLPPSLATTLRLSGRHHFGGHYDEVAKAILGTAKKY